MTESAATPAQALQAPPLRRRMACWLYEGLLLAAVLAVTGFIFNALTGVASLPWQRTFFFIVLAVYFGWQWRYGQTLPMKTWRIRVVDGQGRPLSTACALRRYLCTWLWFLPPLAAVAPFKLHVGEIGVLVLGWVAVWALLSRLHPERQFWHDALAGTRLIAEPPAPPQS